MALNSDNDYSQDDLDNHSDQLNPNNDTYGQIGEKMNAQTIGKKGLMINRFVQKAVIRIVWRPSAKQ